MSEIILGAGCFWGVQYYFDLLSDGIIETEVGYAGGLTDAPTYEQVCYENTGHAEVCKIVYDDSKITLRDILHNFFLLHDPTQINRQGPDIRDEYRSIILYTDDSQKAVIDTVLDVMRTHISGDIVTQVAKLQKFWPAEDYHQKFTERTGRGICHTSPEAVAETIREMNLI